MSTSRTSLTRALSLWDALALLVGSVIGSGVFLKTAVMAQLLSDPWLVLGAWVAAGLLSIAGALTYAELGAMFPEAGGDYIYLREAYGDKPAFLWAWMQLTAGSTGALAAVATAFAIFLSALIPLGGPWATHTFHLPGGDLTWSIGPLQMVAVSAIIVFSVFNSISVAVGGSIQAVLTLAKVLGIGILAGGAFLLADDAAGVGFQGGSSAWAGSSAFGAAMLAALWAYQGWYDLPKVAGEVKNPERNVPRALIYGMLFVTFVYVLVNASYFFALPFEDVLTSNSTAHPGALPVAGKTARVFWGDTGARFVSVIFVVSALGTVNATALAGARVPYAVAADGLFFRSLGKVSSRGHVPVRAIAFQATWASILALSGTFDQITTYTVFVLWIFYGITGAGVFVLRRKMPDAPRPYRTFGYPVVPGLLVIVAAWLVVNTAIVSPVESIAGLVLIGLGIPVYFWFRRQR